VHRSLPSAASLNIFRKEYACEPRRLELLDGAKFDTGRCSSWAHQEVGLRLKCGMGDLSRKITSVSARIFEIGLEKIPKGRRQGNSNREAVVIDA